MKDDFLSLNHMGKKIILSSLYVAPDAWIYYEGKSSVCQTLFGAEMTLNQYIYTADVGWSVSE